MNKELDIDPQQLSPEEVIQLYTHKIELQPDRPFSIYRDLGSAYAQTQQFDRAVEAFQKSIQLQPQRSLLHCLLPQAEHERGHYLEAIESYMQAIQLTPNQPYKLYDSLNELLSQTQRLEFRQNHQLFRKLGGLRSRLGSQSSSDFSRLLAPGSHEILRDFGDFCSTSSDSP